MGNCWAFWFSTLVLQSWAGIVLASTDFGLQTQACTQWLQVHKQYLAANQMLQSSDFPEWQWFEDHLVCHLWYPDTRMRKFYVGVRKYSQTMMGSERLIVSEHTCPSNFNLTILGDVLLCRQPFESYTIQWKDGRLSARLAGNGELPATMKFVKFENRILVKAWDEQASVRIHAFGVCQSY